MLALVLCWDFIHSSVHQSEYPDGNWWTQCRVFIHRNAQQSKYPHSRLMKISRANAVRTVGLTKRNITGTTGCQLGLLIPSWAHSAWQPWLAGLSTGVFPLLAAIFPQEGMARPPPASLGTRLVLGMQGNTFTQPNNILASGSWKTFHCLPSPWNCPNTLEMTVPRFAANWETCFTALMSENRTHLFWGRIFCLVIYQSAESDPEQSFVAFHSGLPTRALYPKAAQAHCCISV